MDGVRKSRRACGSTQRVLTSGQKPTTEMKEYLKRRLFSIMSCMNWVCAGIVDGHEWVSESTITQREEVMGRELVYENCVLCVAMVHAVVLGANTVESNIRKPRNKHRKALRSREHGDCVRDLETLWVWCIHTPRSCMLTTVAGLLYKTPNRSWDVNKEMAGWGMGCRLELLPFVGDDVDENSDE